VQTPDNKYRVQWLGIEQHHKSIAQTWWPEMVLEQYFYIWLRDVTGGTFFLVHMKCGDHFQILGLLSSNLFGCKLSDKPLKCASLSTSGN
jgi:hypothetical protein